MTEDAEALAELEAVQEVSEGSLLGRINSNRSTSGGSKPASPAGSAANLAAGLTKKGAWAEAAKVSMHPCLLIRRPGCGSYGRLQDDTRCCIVMQACCLANVD